MIHNNIHDPKHNINTAPNSHSIILTATMRNLTQTLSTYTTDPITASDQYEISYATRMLDRASWNSQLAIKIYDTDKREYLEMSDAIPSFTERIVRVDTKYRPHIKVVERMLASTLLGYFIARRTFPTLFKDREVINRVKEFSDKYGLMSKVRYIAIPYLAYKLMKPESKANTLKKFQAYSNIAMISAAGMAINYAIGEDRRVVDYVKTEVVRVTPPVYENATKLKYYDLEGNPLNRTTFL
jgi:hypothetical protein